MRRAARPARINTFSFGFLGGCGELRRMELADQHNEIELNFIERGGMTLLHGAREVTVGPGDLVIYWAAIPHQVTSVRPHTTLAWMALPLSWFLAWNLPPALGRRVLDGEILHIDRDAAAREPGLPEAGMLRWTRDLQKKSPELNRIAELEIEAYFRRLALACAVRPGPPRFFRKSPPGLQNNQYGHVQKMVRFMTSQFREPVTVPQIAAAAGLNAEYAMRLFRKCWGMTIGEFLRQQRVWHAQRLLVLGGEKIVDIAFSSGFGSTSRFYSAFRSQCRCTPQDYRRQPPPGGE